MCPHCLWDCDIATECTAEQDRSPSQYGARGAVTERWPQVARGARRAQGGLPMTCSRSAHSALPFSATGGWGAGASPGSPGLRRAGTGFTATPHSPSSLRSVSGAVAPSAAAASLEEGALTERLAGTPSSQVCDQPVRPGSLAYRCPQKLWNTGEIINPCLLRTGLPRRKA